MTNLDRDEEDLLEKVLEYRELTGYGSGRIRKGAEARVAALRKELTALAMYRMGNGESALSVARRLGVSNTTLTKWIASYESLAKLAEFR